MVIVDSTIWIDYFANRFTRHTDWLDAHLRDTRIGLTDLILCEVLQGIRDEKEFLMTQSDLLAFSIFPIGSVELAIAAAKNYQRLRSKGITVRKTIDRLIATFCIREGHALLHNDRDFEPFERNLGLQVIHP